MSTDPARTPDTWPALPLHTWIATRDTFHRWLQIVGKVRLAQTPPVNHSWHSTLYVTARGLTTSPIPHGRRTFEINLDLLDHRLAILTTDGATAAFDLQPMTVAAFFRRFEAALDALGIPVRIVARPNELPDAMPFAADEIHQAYDPDAVRRFWRVLVETDRVMKIFRGRFIGKCSPAHLFWGAMDLALTRFSGRRAPMHPGGVPNLPDAVAQEAYSHEVISCGFWTGTAPVDYPAFYAYAYPEPSGFAAAPVPHGAFYSPEFREFILPYDVVRLSSDPEAALLEFFEATYAAGADLGGWDRAAVERR